MWSLFYDRTVFCQIPIAEKDIPKTLITVPFLRDHGISASARVVPLGRHIHSFGRPRTTPSTFARNSFHFVPHEISH